MRIAIDGTAAAVQHAGVGRYTRELLKALVALPGAREDRYQVMSASDRMAADALFRSLPPGAWREVRRLPVPERVMTAAWQRLRVPLPVDVFTGAVDVFHGPDFVVPPSRSPLVVTIHDLSYLKAPEYGEPALVAYLSAAVPRSLRRASQVITVSASVAAELVDAYPFVEQKVRAIPNGVTMPVVPDDAPEYGSSRPRVLIVGTIEPRKNHSTLLAAMQHVWERYPDAELVVAGRIGWKSDVIMDDLRRASADLPVRLLTSASDEELERAFRDATVFVYPSHYEGFGLPVLEAMARGVPVVAGDIPSLRETGSDDALYANVHDPEALGAAIKELLDDRELRDRLAQAGRMRAAKYSWNETARRTRLAYEAAIGGNIP